MKSLLSAGKRFRCKVNIACTWMSIAGGTVTSHAPWSRQAAKSLPAGQDLQKSATTPGRR